MDKVKLNIGWVRTFVGVIATTAIVLTAYYFDRAYLKDEIAKNAIAIQVATNKPHLTIEALEDRFVSRREYESAQVRLCKDIDYLRNKLDSIYTIITTKRARDSP